MEQPGGSVQNAVKSACSITYVSEKLGISRPTLYKYMEHFDTVGPEGLPVDVVRFLSFISSKKRTEEDVILYFMGKWVPEKELQQYHAPSKRVRVIVSGGRVMVVFPDSEPETTFVRIHMGFDGDMCPIGDYKPTDGRRFVTIDDLISGEDFICETISCGETIGSTRFRMDL